MNFFKKFQKLILHIILYKRIKSFISRSAQLGITHSKQQRNNFRINAFNKMWQDAYTNIPYYNKIKISNNLPDQINNLNDLNKWPILTKKIIQENYSQFFRKSPPKYFIKTGGSSGNPLTIGFDSGVSSSVNQWIGRAQHGYYLGANTFLIWGHHHLLGKGFKKYFNSFKRLFFDTLLNYKRLSGYDLSDKVMHSFFDDFLKYKPEFVIGYSAALLAFCRANNDSVKQIKNVKAVFSSGGPLSLSERTEISSFFSCPLIMEYGSAECGVMAYTNDTFSDYNVFWDSHLIQPHKLSENKFKNLVTRLTLEYTPLIRFDIGDFIDVSNFEDDFPITIKDVVGRPSELIEFDNGLKVYFIIINDIIKQIKGVKAIQIFKYINALEIFCMREIVLSKKEIKFIMDKLLMVANNFKDIKINIYSSKSLEKTESGKIKNVIVINKYLDD